MVLPSAAVTESPQTQVRLLAEQLRAAAHQDQKLCVQGAGSRAACLAAPFGSQLSATDHRGIVAYDPGDLVVTVRAGTPLEDLDDVLAAQGQMLGFEPPRRPGSTVGGAIALGWSGPRRPFSGALRDHVTGVRLLDGQGRELRFGGTVVKNVAGFDVPRLMAGSRGALGLLLEASLRVVPKPAREITRSLDCSIDEAVVLLPTLAVGPGLLSGASWLAGRLRLRYGGSARSLDALPHPTGGPWQVEDNTLAASFWRQLRDQTHAFFDPRAGLQLWRASVRLGAPRFAEAQDTALDWAGALHWLWLPPGDAGDRLARWAQQHGGHAQAWPPREPAPLPPALMRLQHRVADAFDPRRILHRGRLLAAEDR